MINFVKISIPALCLSATGCAALPTPHSSNLAVAEPIALEDLARAPDIYSVALDPSGDRVAFIETVAGRGEIRVRKLADDTVTPIFRDPERTLSNVTWSADGRWLLYLQDAGGDEGYCSPSAPMAQI